MSSSECHLPGPLTKAPFILEQSSHLVHLSRIGSDYMSSYSSLCVSFLYTVKETASEVIASLLALLFMDAHLPDCVWGVAAIGKWV